MRVKLINELKELLTKYNFNISIEQIYNLVDYILLLNKWNKVYNLTSVRSPIEMLSKHILDSISINEHLKGNTFADVGTGPGLPGIPLSIINPDKRFYLIDSRSKRITFLNQVIIDLKLKNVKTILSRVEDISNFSFDGIITRAFSSIDVFLKLTNNICSNNSRFYSLKGIFPKEEINLIEKNKDYSIENIINLNLENILGQRHLIIIKKI